MPRKPNPELIDDENPEWTEADFARARPAAEVLREQFGAGAEQLLKPKRSGAAKVRRRAASKRRRTATGRLVPASKVIGKLRRRLASARRRAG